MPYEREGKPRRDRIPEAVWAGRLKYKVWKEGREKQACVCPGFTKQTCVRDKERLRQQRKVLYKGQSKEGSVMVDVCLYGLTLRDANSQIQTTAATLGNTHKRK